MFACLITPRYRYLTIDTLLSSSERDLFRKRWAIVTNFSWISFREAYACGTVTLLRLARSQRAQRGPNTCWQRIISRLDLASTLGPLLSTIAHIVRSILCILSFNSITLLITHMIYTFHFRNIRFEVSDEIFLLRRKSNDLWENISSTSLRCFTKRCTSTSRHNSNETRSTMMTSFFAHMK